jgi:hypothetical protein
VREAPAQLFQVLVVPTEPSQHVRESPRQICDLVAPAPRLQVTHDSAMGIDGRLRVVAQPAQAPADAVGQPGQGPATDGEYDQGLAEQRCQRLPTYGLDTERTLLDHHGPGDFVAPPQGMSGGNHVAAARADTAPASARPTRERLAYLRAVQDGDYGILCEWLGARSRQQQCGQWIELRRLVGREQATSPRDDTTGRVHHPGPSAGGPTQAEDQLFEGRGGQHELAGPVACRPPGARARTPGSRSAIDYLDAESRAE